MSCQSKFIRLYNDNYKEKFNDNLFVRDHYEIIEELEKIIISCQKNQPDYVIKVLGFKVVEDYKTIVKIMQKYEKKKYSKKKKKRIDTFSYVNLKDSDFVLLIVSYYIRDKKHSNCIDVYIQIPRIVNKYYFKIMGNYYSAIYQIVDGSTYNNITTTNKNKNPNITLRTLFKYVKIFGYVNNLKDINNDTIISNTYNIYVFNKSCNVCKYILAKFGLVKTLSFLQFRYIVRISKNPSNDEDDYSFEKNGIYINVSKYMYDRDNIIQTFVCCICRSIDKHTKYENLFDNKYWLEVLGSEFTKGNKIEKGKSILNSLESIYDLKTREIIRVPLKDKDSIYCILRWMIREFSKLKYKDNLDLSTKRIRYSEYLASLYAMKLVQAIYRLSDSKKVTIKSIQKVILIHPSFFLDNIVKCNLVNCRNLVNDLDSITALKFSYKGISGMGEKNISSVPEQFRYIDPSNLGRIDMDSSSKSDPGMTGILSPMCKTYTKYNSFSKFEESNTWEDEFNKTINEYQSLVGIKEIIEFKQDLLNIEDKDNRIEKIEEDLQIIKNLFHPIKRTMYNTTKNVFVRSAEDGGNIYYGSE